MILIDDVIYLILFQTELHDVSTLSRINTQFATVCRSERGIKEIKRKQQEYFDMIEEILDIGGIELYEIVQRNFMSYLSERQYRKFVLENCENYQMCTLLGSTATIEDLILSYPDLKQLILETNRNILRGLLYQNRGMVKPLRAEIQEIVLKFRARPRMCEVDW